MKYYSAYGLAIESAFPLPRLSSISRRNPDIVIRPGSISVVAGGHSGLVQTTADTATFFWEGIGAFAVRDGKEIVVDASPELEERVLALPLTGTLLAVLLHQRGYLILHGSSISVRGRGLAFLGAKGQGKSTTAAMLHIRGHRMVADDVLAIDTSGDIPMAITGFPEFKLWPDAAEFVGDDPMTLSQLANGYDKRSRPVTHMFSPEPVPLTNLFILNEEPGLALTSLNPQESIVQLIAHSYVARFGNKLLSGSCGATHLAQCAYIVNKVDVKRLGRPFGLDLLGEVAEIVERCVAPGRALEHGALASA